MNLIPKIAELLGVEIGEEFEANGKTVKFTLDGLYHYFNDGHGLECWKRAECTMYGLLNGEYEVEKLPYVPKDGEMYYTVAWDREKIWCPDVTWREYGEHYCRKYCGNVFRTEKEAEKHKYEIYEKLTGKRWEE